jgi:hypothetical protein
MAFGQSDAKRRCDSLISQERQSGRFGSLAVVHPDTTRMSPLGRIADIGYAGGGHKKARYKTGLSIFGSGGAFAENICLYAEPFPLVA